jgi:hypothetical protein
MQIERNCRATLMRPLPCKVLVCARAKQLKQLHNSDPSYFSPAIFAEPSPGTPSPRSQATVAAAAAAKRQCAPRREGAVLRNAARPGQAYRRATQFANDPRATACLPVGFGASNRTRQSRAPGGGRVVAAAPTQAVSAATLNQPRAALPAGDVVDESRRTAHDTHVTWRHVLCVLEHVSAFYCPETRFGVILIILRY